MPPIQQQQTSRGGLITSLVISIVFLVGCLVWAVMTNADLNKAQNDLKVLSGKYSKVIDDSALGDIDTLRGQFSPEADRPRTAKLIDAAADQRKSLVRLITGETDGTEKKANEDVAATIKEIKATPALADVKLPDGAGLTSIIKALVAKAKSDADALAQGKAATAKADADLKAERATHQAEIAKLQQAVQDAQTALAANDTQTKAAIAEKQKQVDDFSGKSDAAAKTANDQQAQHVVDLQTRDRALAVLQQKYDALLNKLAQYRPNVKESIVRNVDAVITQVSPDSIAYINLGFGDHVTPGMTFEVYAKEEGVPKLADGTDSLNMPKGKASIEILSVGQNSSQVRILNARSGVTVAQGDLCVNVVYDRNIKPYFYVYGKFDMDQNGVATETEGEVVKNLVARWGGKISDKISIETDFVVLGKEPVIPVFTPEELTQPLLKDKFEQAKAALDAYNKIRDEAVSLHIPVMNQNRFLYYTGYFDSAKK